MSSYVDMANAEADAIEAEEAEADEADALDTPEPDPEPETEDDGPQAIGPAELRKAENAITAQRRKLAGILGDDFVAHDCPLCSALGFLPELPPVGSRLEVVTDGENIGFQGIAPDAPPELKHAPDKEICDECDGWGQVITGARNPNTAVWQCSKCVGNGYVQAIRPQPGITIPAVTTTTYSGQTPTPGIVLPDDAWGRPAGHQHYGIPPSSVGT